MNNEMTDMAAAWLDQATALARICLQRKAVLQDRLPRFSPRDPEDDRELQQRAAELTPEIVTAQARLARLEAESDVAIGVSALLSADVPDVLGNVVAYLAVAATRESFAQEVRWVGALIEAAAGDDAEAVLVARRALGPNGILRRHVTYVPMPIVTECVDPCRTERALAVVLGTPNDACGTDEIPTRLERARR